MTGRRFIAKYYLERKESRIMLNRKPQIEAHKKKAEESLAARLELLKTQGWDDGRIQKDAKVKQNRARIRKAKHQLEGIAAMAAMVEEKTAAKARKAAAAKEPRQPGQKAAKPAGPRKPKKERKPAADE
jgi:hypothetical protein